MAYTWADLNMGFTGLSYGFPLFLKSAESVFYWNNSMPSIAVRAREHAQVEDRAPQIFFYFFFQCTAHTLTFLPVQSTMLFFPAKNNVPTTPSEHTVSNVMYVWVIIICFFFRFSIPRAHSG